jgi:hypothetical protein
MVIGEADLGIGLLAGEEAHDALLQLRDRLVLAQHQVVGLRGARPALVQLGHLHPHHPAGGRLLALDRDPGGLLLLQPGELLLDGAIGHGGDAPLDPEAAGPLELELRPDLDQQIELDGGAVFELEVPNGRVRDRLERLGRLHGLPAFADHFLEHRLPDGVAEPLPDDAFGRLAGAEPGQPRPLHVVLERLGLRLPHAIDGHGDPKRFGGRVLGGLLDGDLTHSARNLPPRGPQGQFCPVPLTARPDGRSATRYRRRRRRGPNGPGSSPPPGSSSAGPWRPAHRPPGCR